MQNYFPKIKPLLAGIKHPSRYIGGEFRTKPFCAKDTDFNFCMVYPDIYDVGQSNSAVKIICNCVNEIEGFAAQRSYLPDKQTMEIFKSNNVDMFSLETFSPLSEFDAIGITVSHELLATNVIQTLDFASIPIFSKFRKEDDPYVFGGGPMCANPEPFHAFFDVITIGEGEIATVNALKTLKELKEKGWNRSDILHELSKLDNIYVPSLYEVKDGHLHPKFDDVPAIISRAIYEDFNSSKALDDCIVPYVEIVHDRLNVEILRGCSRGCRFCQAGIMYRPVRERSVDNICESVIEGLKKTGYDEVSLVSLSSTDHSQIKEILTQLNSKLSNSGVRISIPSQRLDSFGIDMAKLVCGNKKGGLTFAIEAATQRLRDVINKNVDESDIFSAVEHAFSEGWNRAKLYFMIGLPSETDDDVIEIANLCERILEAARKAAGVKRKHGVSISVSCAIFVPKAQTPFMFDGQITIEQAIRKVNLIRKHLHSKAISFSWHSPQTSLIEGVLSRGDRRCADLIYEAWKCGSTFDAWNETFNFDAWLKAGDNLGMNLQDIASKNINYNDESYLLPWSHIDFGLNNSFFVEERKKADKAITTKDCTFNNCTNCGICQNLQTNIKLAGKRQC